MSPLCAVRPHLDLQIHLVCSKNTSNPWMGSSLALSVPSYGDKWLPIPACRHHSVQNYANVSIHHYHPHYRYHYFYHYRHCTHSMWCRNDNFVHTLCGAATTTLYTLYVVPHRQLRSISLKLSNVHYVMGGGWDMYTQKCNRIRVNRPTGIESDLTYLTYLLTYIPGQKGFLELCRASRD